MTGQATVKSERRVILANPVSSSPAGGAGLAGQVAGVATGAGLMAGTSTTFALDLGAATAGMGTTAGAEAVSRGSGARGGIPVAGLRQLHVDASMLVQMDAGAGLPATVPANGWSAGAVRTGEGATAQPTGDLGAEDSIADAAPGVADQTGIAAGTAGILSGMIAATGQASTALNNTPAGTRFSAVLSAGAAVGASNDLPGAAQGGVSRGGTAIGGSGTAGAGGAMPQPAMPGAAAVNMVR